MKQEHHPKDVRTNSKGATYDVDPELSGNADAGTYFDSDNGRVSSDRGNKSSWEKVRGEVEVHNTTQPGTWENLVSIPVNGCIFEIWVEESGAGDPYIAIDGQIMGQSPNMPWLYEHKIQFDVNESCVGGEVFLTDFNTAPTIFNIQNIKDEFAAGNETYFDDFNLNLYGIGLNYALDIPVFTRLVDLGSTGGLAPGSYKYSMRYINDDGDATNWSLLTPPIPVVKNLSSNSPQYPWSKTYGSAPNLVNKTRYGVELKYRITNLNDYDFIEIRRISYDAGTNTEYVPIGTLVLKQDIAPGEISIRTYVDPRDSNIDEEVLDETSENSQLASIARAKAIRYYDKRVVLMNIETTSKDTSDINIIEYNGKKIFPIVHNLGKPGFFNPVNHTYKKNYPSDEKFTFGVNFFDGMGGSGFVLEDDDLKNVEVPGRRAEMDTDSQNFSYGGSVTAANVNSGVTKTFEVFDHEDAVKKTDECSFKNILDAGSKSDGTVNEYCADAGYGGTVKGEEIGYQPFYPENEVDQNVVSHNYKTNLHVFDKDDDEHEYNPKGFGCNYFSKGFAFGGVDNVPSWVKAFSVVRSQRAGRVVCQGMATYKLIDRSGVQNTNNPTQAAKEKKELIFHSQDILSGIVSSTEIQNMLLNPQDYEVKFSSPLGFFSELYSFRDKSGGGGDYDGYSDLISYARIIRDDGQINPDEDPNMGVNGYVAYNRYRNTSDNAGQGAFNVIEGGEKLFTLSNVATYSGAATGAVGTLLLEFNEEIYHKDELSDRNNNDFDDQEMMDWTEPMYIANIIKKGAVVQDLNINEYYSTGHYQKIESIIGKGNGTSNQSFELVDERWEDCVPSLTPTGFNNGGESFLYLSGPSGAQRRLFNVTYKTPAEVLVIMNDITTNGFYTTPGGIDIVGVYTHSYVSGIVYINFDNAITIPTEDDTIIVKYDNTRPIRFWGGDTVVGETVMPLINMETDANGESVEQAGDPLAGGGKGFDLAFPFRRWELNPRIYVVKHTTGANKIQNDNICRLGKVRQICIMYAAETVISTPYSFAGAEDFYQLLSTNIGSVDNFPRRHYVMRPLDVKQSDPLGLEENNIFSDYKGDSNFWGWGGFNFSYGHNTDYSVRGPLLYFSKPDVGFTEETYFCTGIAWSLPRAVNQQNSPGLKTFPETNRFYMSDDNGEIKKAWNARTDGKGENLYAITQSGTALLVTQKAILSNLNADDLTVTGVDKFISQEYWISQAIGSNSEMWRGMAEGAIELLAEDGKVEREALYIPNSHSVYRLMNNTIKEIAKGKYYHRIHPSLQNIQPGYTTQITGHYDKNHNEYWLQMPDLLSRYTFGAPACFGFAQDTGYFIGTIQYRFDQYAYMNSQNYGFRNGIKYQLDTGFEMNGAPIIARLIQHTSVNEIFEKEFISIEVNTGLRGTMKPTSITFMDEEQNILCIIDEAQLGPEYLKQYDGWWNQIPRKILPASPNRDRLQYRLILFEILHNFEEDFKVVSSVIQYKPLK